MISSFRIRSALAFAAAYVALPLVAAVVGRHDLDPELSTRMIGVLMGALVLAWANAVPKQLMPLARLSCDPAREQALRRFSGWTLALGALGYLLAYALAPIAIAGTLAICILAPATAAVALAVARCAWLARRAG